MIEWNDTAEGIMQERFGADTVMALATVANGIPYVRDVNAYYEDGAFFLITTASSNKMRQIEESPLVALSGPWFTSHGMASSPGYFSDPKNEAIAGRMKDVFAEWIDKGHYDFSECNTIILKIDLIDADLVSRGRHYVMENRTEGREVC